MFIRTFSESDPHLPDHLPHSPGPQETRRLAAGGVFSFFYFVKIAKHYFGRGGGDEDGLCEVILLAVIGRG